MQTNKIEEYNKNFLKFDGRADITAPEIATIINYAKHSNDKNE